MGFNDASGGVLLIPVGGDPCENGDAHLPGVGRVGTWFPRGKTPAAGGGYSAWAAQTFKGG